MHSTLAVDDIAGWIQSVSSRTLLSRRDWKEVAYTASGYIHYQRGRSQAPHGSVRRLERRNGEHLPRFGHADPKTPFTAEYKVPAPPGRQLAVRSRIAAGNFAGSGSDGLFVRWKDAE
ncbi:hypothetical protein GCM10020221_15610 [Streptomyces thioluteus]|uniref:Uncharacterized protein n=1 Tax=Streptomyces thioluteus TaxID=66431 RepID=A0ABP6J3Y9_STRTU